jgi:hypothetical protein
MAAKRILSGVGRVIHEDSRTITVVTYNVELDSNGVYPSIVELGELPPSFPHDARVLLELADGSHLWCLRLDCSRLCVGEGEPMQPSPLT